MRSIHLEIITNKNQIEAMNFSQIAIAYDLF
jgi:hypothetical protein